MQRIFTELRLLRNGKMKKFLWLNIILFFSMPATAQKYDSWTFFHNRKEAASFNLKKETNDERRVVLLSRSLEYPGFFIIEYTPAAAQADWIRSIGFFDTSGKQINVFNNTLLLKVHNNDIALMLDKRQVVQVYSWAVPKDPAVAATVKVRRVLLCTLYIR